MGIYHFLLVASFCFAFIGTCCYKNKDWLGLIISAVGWASVFVVYIFGH